MENILLIHIGAPKTGTTALQNFLYLNEKQLKKYGWCYPDLKKELPYISSYYSDEDKNADIFYGKDVKIDTNAENWKRAWECVLLHLKESNVILSAEEIFTRDRKKFLQGLIKVYNNIKVVVYLRRQDRAIESWWNQRIKHDCCIKTFHEFVNSDGLDFEFHYLNQLDEISEIIGKENLIVRVYEKEQFYGKEKKSIESDFMHLLGIESDWEQWRQGSRSNDRVSGNYLEIKRIMNSVEEIDNTFTSRYFYIFQELSKSLCGAQEIEKGYFAFEERCKYLEQFAEENKQIARKYLGREDEKLFSDTKMDYPLYDLKKDESFIEDVIRTFTVMILGTMEQKFFRMQKKYKYLEGQYKILGEKMMINLAGEKKIVFFGAGNKCRELLNEVKFHVDLIVDNDEKKKDTQICGIKIKTVSSICDWTEYFVIVTCIETNDMENQLIKFGLEKGKHYILAKEYMGLI